MYGLEKFGGGVLFNPIIRGIIADYAYPIATVFWVGFCHIPGRLKDGHLELLPIGKAFRPTVDRDWVVSLEVLGV